ncbi:hypothetical protein GCM10009592_30120 [Brachybacterium rhamnosum]
MTAASGGPRLRVGTDTKEPASGLVAVLRLLAALFVLTNAVAALVGVGVVLGLRKWRQVRAWWVLLAGVALLLAMLLGFTLGPPYVRWALELVPTVVDAMVSSGPRGVPAAVGPLVEERWTAWLLGQLPLAIALGCTIGAGLSMYVRRHDAPWRQPTRNRSVMSREKAMRRTTKMETWAPAPKAAKPAPSRKGSGAREAREAPPATVHDVKVRVGIDQGTGRPADVPLAAFLQHCWIDGASGFGKTTDIITLVRGALEAPAAQPLRIPLIYLNLKPDPEVTEAMRRIAHRAGRRFLHVSLDGQLRYNPIRHGTAGAVATRIVEVEAAAVDGGFSEPFHKANGQELLGYATRALDELVARDRTYERGGKRLPWRRDLHHLHRIMRLSTLMSVRHHLSGDLQLDLADYAEELEEIPRKRESAEGMRARIGKMLTSAVGPLLGEDAEGLNLEDALRAGDVVVFDLDSMQDTVAATSMANLAIKDLQAVLGHLGSQSWNRTGDKVTRMAMIVVDEFSALGGDAVVDLLQRGRTNGAAVVLATQDVGSVVESSEGLLTTILTNTNVQVVHVQSERAEDYAKSWGTQQAMAETTQVFEDRTLLGTLTSKSGQGSLRTVKEFVIHPDVLRKLGPGEAILATRHPWQQRRVLVQRAMPKPLTEEELAATEESAPPPAELPEQPEPAAAEEPAQEPPATAAPEPAPAPESAGEEQPAAPEAGPTTEDVDPWGHDDDFSLFDHDTEEQQ